MPRGVEASAASTEALAKSGMKRLRAYADANPAQVFLIVMGVIAVWLLIVCASFCRAEETRA